MPRRNLIWTVAIIAAALAVLVFTRNRRQGGRGGGYVDPVSNAVRIVREKYLYEVDEAGLRRAAIRGMVEQLDPHSTYLPSGAAGVFDDRMDGRAFGTGMHVDISDGSAVVIGPLPDSPALRAGLRAGDRILEIGDRRVASLDAGRIRRLLHPPQPAPEPIRLRLRRDGEKTRPIDLKPQKYPIESVQGLFRDHENRWVHLLGDRRDVVYVRIREFVPDTHQRARSVLRRFDKLPALVLDLRDNPGGRLPIAWQVSNLFLHGGVIVTMEHKTGRPETHKADSPDTFPRKIPIVALIDERTASGAELVAAALQYHGRAVLVGTRTRGKGCVQSMIDLGGGLGYLNLTTAEFYVDPLRRIARRPGSQTWGVDPDVEVIVPAARRGPLRRLRLRSEVIAGRGPATGPARPDSAAAADEIGRRITTLDSQLRRAMALVTDPAEMEEILERARETRAATRRAAEKSKEGRPARSRLPSSGGQAPGAGR